MSKANQAFISGKLGVEPIMINSALLTAQQRKRSYWVGKLIDGKYEQVKINQPKDKGVLLEDILQDLPDCPLGIKVRDKSNCLRVGGRNSPFGSKQIWDSPFQRISKKGNIKPGIEKASCLTGGGNSGGNPSDMDLIHSPFVTRRYSILECERLQGFPDDYTNHVSNTQRYKSLGNSFTVPVIKHILTNSIK
jgi:site-specific DNA-cytosine methylase